MDLKQYIRDVPDFPKPGILFKDITTLLQDGEAFGYAIRQMADRYRGQGIQKVAGIEARGFIFAAAVAYELGIGMVPIRKVGKLPAKCVKKTYDLEYGTDCVEIHEDAVSKGEKVLVVDDVIATGGTLAAACDLVGMVGGEVVEALVLVELTFLSGRDRMGGKPVFSLLSY
jgi:adenine phosphoribosyltransferase